jgi:transcriptional regulator with XRE-family HTH domain/SAM-dependent methyltransferase
MSEVGQLVQALVASETGGREAVAVRLGVSASTVGRWEAGKSTPRPQLEGKIRALVARRLSPEDANQMQGVLSWSREENGDREVRDALLGTLREVREALHRRARISSRHEALDEIGKLLFSHIVSVDTGGPGISKALLTNSSSNPAESLRSFVEENARLHLPHSLSHEISPKDFYLRLRPEENELATELIQSFVNHASPRAIANAQGVGQLDVLNDVFGQFLADSFIDEKELGQYLTPTEVVRFMVHLGLDSLDEADVHALCDPEQVGEAGIVLDPSCGAGSFLAEAVRVLYARVRKTRSPEELLQWTSAVMASSVIGIDKSERMIKLALTNLALFGASQVNLHLINSLARDGSEGGTADSLNGRAKLILTNPPFGAEYPSSGLSAFKLVTNWARRSTPQVDSELLFMERYFDWLSPGGVLLAVVPDSVLTNRGLYENLRSGLRDELDLLSVVSLPPVTFAAAGTSTKTSVLHARKRRSDCGTRARTYFAICHEIGFEVSTRGAQRRKVATGKEDLSVILDEACSKGEPTHGRRAALDHTASRWDATYHAGLPTWLEGRMAADAPGSLLTVGDIATLSRDRTDPRRLGDSTFLYIEISNVDAKTGRVSAKTVPTSEAPSRARKLVRSGDVLVSTVRPERRAIGVVPEALDGAVCSTGFAVLRPKGVHPMVLLRLLQSDAANAQIMRNNMGIAYPVIEDSCLPGVVLPAEPSSLSELAKTARVVDSAWIKLESAETQFDASVKRTLDNWYPGDD